MTQGSKMVGRPAGWCLIAVAAVVAAAGQATADCITNCYDPDEACPACYKDCTCKSVPNCANNCNSPGECPSCYNQCECSSSPPPVASPVTPPPTVPPATNGTNWCSTTCNSGQYEGWQIFVAATVNNTAGGSDDP